ncbi:MAG: molybdopterin molybdenumtransferase MoeA, partial [Deltaproteobacteria bacterium]|nr:molybdopterin molybdenumtransferase MoeA [Deltaproteobacteria bacterium]
RSFDGAVILAHGVSISPGKPTILARVGSKSLWGLPGHVTSAMVVFELFVARLLDRLLGIPPDLEQRRTVKAIIAQNIPSAQGREDYIRVRLRTMGDVIQAEPMFGKSGLLSTMVKADGLVKIDLNDEGLEAGSLVKVRLFL